VSSLRVIALRSIPKCTFSPPRNELSVEVVIGIGQCDDLAAEIARSEATTLVLALDRARQSGDGHRHDQAETYDNFVTLEDTG
jgi:hypothetical protein